MNAHCDNPFLLASGLFASTAACLAAVPSNNIPYGSDWANIPTDQQMFLMHTMRRYVVGGDGSFDLFGKSWNWDSYFQHGETDTSIKINNMPLSGAPSCPMPTTPAQ